ncbi:helix-turn-helix domain-containing protein [Rhodococcus chondri]|uniref:Helix-turn-helix domain-containing protein n=1 Tax=Rhodococcus chondri TaxID=3065941 RepID=A0ABU7JZE2_9NOCA|nr:helix-turn-helix domain-containing protein [Rhodococcus sp. CC-R104]MEE2035260.1 helix-turn-helix domain-containing protein [Rhodococcus sp. CC-R104]
MATVEYDSAGGSESRRYRSPLRRMQAAQTRAGVLEVAVRLFAERGWAGTAMRDVARTAGVSVETVYATFGSKAQLLKAALDVAVVGDDEPLPLADRRVYKAIGAARTTGDRIQLAAHMATSINERLYRLAVALRQGAMVDATLADIGADLDGQRRRSVADVAGLIMGRRPHSAQVDELWVQTGEQVYALFVDECGWSRVRYEAWLMGRIEEILHRPV